MSLIGKFFCHMGAEYMHTGKVVAQVDAASVLVEISSHIPKTLAIIELHEMRSTIARDGSIETNWDFFGTEAELEAWVTWLKTPSEDELGKAASASLN